MLSKVNTVNVLGLQCSGIDVEVDVMRGMPAFAIVGLADMAVQEAKERIKSSIRNSGYAFPTKRLVINLAPASIRKQSAAFDLPMALGILHASEQIPTLGKDTVYVGELALDGSLRHVNGVLSMVLYAKKRGFSRIILPSDNVLEASMIEGMTVYGANNLGEVVRFLQGDHAALIQGQAKEIKKKYFNGGEERSFSVDMKDIIGQSHVKRAIEIAASGGHNIILSGPPGSGKSMIAKAMQGILPPMSMKEALEVTEIYSAAGMLPKGTPLLTSRPFRNVHHTASSVSIVGGGRIPRPGEVSMAHRGVLFLDELLEFPKEVLEVLRQPLEDRVISVSRALGSESYPASFMLVAAMNPCPCGYLTDTGRECTCTEYGIERYQKKLSGPLLDRIDMYVEVPRVEMKQMNCFKGEGESSHRIAERVAKVREIQQRRFQEERIHMNSEMNNEAIKKYCPLDPEGEVFALRAVDKLQLSARSYFRLLRLSRTIADMDDSSAVKVKHISEALQYRKRN